MPRAISQTALREQTPEPPEVPSSTSVVAGLDVSKATVDVALRPGGQSWQARRTAAGLQELAQRLREQATGLAVLEATGGLERVVATALHAEGVPVAVVAPRRIRAFAHARGTAAKTDRLDAEVLAHYGQVMAPAPRPAPDPERESLAALVERRRQVVAIRTAEKNRQQQATGAMAERIARHIAWLDQEVKELRAQITQALAARAEWKDLSARLQGVPGVGLITAATLIAELPELGTTPPKQLASLVGVAPHARDSGT
jgi:transposase